MKQDSIRLLVVEDHNVVRQGLVALLNAMEGFNVVAEAADGEEAVRQFLIHDPDVTLIDLRLPRLSGVEAILRVRAANPQARFIVLTTYDGDEDIYRALQAGAKAYLLKGMTAAELVVTIKDVHAGKTHIPQLIAEKLVQRVGAAELTPREFNVLEGIAAGGSNKQIAGHLCVSESTIKSHVNKLLSKLGVTDRTHATTTALQRGIITMESLRHRD